jgi:hypothetical protein
MTQAEIANLIAPRQAERVESCPYVFHRQENRVKHYNRAWRTAREKAGLPVQLMHDTWRTRAYMVNLGHNTDKQAWQENPSLQRIEK